MPAARSAPWRARQRPPCASPAPRLTVERLAAGVAAGLVVLLAAVLRLAALDLTPLKLDEVDALSRARALVEEGALPMTGGQMSWGLPDPPLVIYLLAVPAAVSRQPAVAAGFMGLLDALGVALCYVIGARQFGRSVGLVAGLLYATCPWAVYYARDVWVNIVPLLTAVALLAAMQVVARRQQHWAAAFFLALAAQAQTHLLAVVELVPGLLTVAAFHRRWLSLVGLLALGVGCLLSLPYLSTAAIGLRDQMSVASLAHVAWSTDRPLAALELGSWALSGFHFEELIGGGQPTGFAPFAAALRVVQAVIAGLLVIGTVACVRAAVRREPAGGAKLLLVIWTWTPVAVMAVAAAGVPLSLHYFTLLYPAAFLLAAVGVHAVVRWMARTPRTTAMLVVALGISTVQTVALYESVVQFPRAELGAGVGLPTGVWTNIAAQVRQLMHDAGTRDVRVLTRGDDVTVADYPAALRFVLGPEPQPIFVKDGSLGLSANHPTIYVDLLGDDAAVDLLGRFGRLEREIPLPGGREAARMFVVHPRSPAELAAVASEPRSIAMTHGLHLLGEDRPRVAHPGDSVVVTTYWWFSDFGSAERNDDLTFFHHMLDPAGRTVAQHDGIGVPSARWREGDALVQRSLLHVPPEAATGRYRLVCGLYSRRDGQRARRLDNAADAIDLGSVDVRTGDTDAGDEPG